MIFSIVSRKRGEGTNAVEEGLGNLLGVPPSGGLWRAHRAARRNRVAVGGICQIAQIIGLLRPLTLTL